MKELYFDLPEFSGSEDCELIVILTPGTGTIDFEIQQKSDRQPMESNTTPVTQYEGQP